MRICADEHVSQKIVQVARNIALSSKHEICHVLDVGNRGASDVSWITEFARDGGEVILTADSDFHRRPHQVCDNGLIVIHLHPKWANSKRQIQAAFILFWWDIIENTLDHSPARSVRRRSFDVGRLASGRRRGGILARVWTSGPPDSGMEIPDRKAGTEEIRVSYHTRSMGTARPGASALAGGQHLPPHVATVPIR